MEFSKFLKLLKKHKYGLLAIPILVMAISFFLTKSMPNVYFSSSRLSAGLTAGSGVSIAQQILNNTDITETKINQTFSNVTQTMQLKIVYDQVSYQLILHDLTASEPFRRPSKLLEDLNPEARKHAIEVYTKMYNQKLPLFTTDPDQNGLYEVLKSMRYDYESLRDKIKVYRVENSDFIDVTYESENPSLSAFVVNTLCTEFITYYSALTQQGKVKANDFLYDLMMKKKDSLNNKNDSLKNYKIRKRVLNIPDEVANLYTQVANYENQLQVTQKEIAANTSAIAAINAKFNQQEKEYIDSKQALINQDIVATQDQLSKLNEQYIRSNFDETLKTKMDALRKTLEQKINQSTDKYMVSTLVAKENLIAQKLKLETELALAKGSEQTYKNAIGSINGRLQRLAPNQADIQAMESDIAVTTKEYTELLNKYNQSAMQLSSSSPIKQVEAATPGIKQPSKKLIIVILSGIVSFVVYLLILFVLFYLDDSIKDPNDLIDKTDTHVLGMLPVIKSSFMDLQKLWNIDTAIPGGTSPDHTRMIGTSSREMQAIPVKSSVAASNSEFKKLIRSTRFEINMALTGGRNLVITSLREEEGKTLVALSLVSAFQMMNKKVLLIDGNFINNGITTMTQPKYFIEDYLLGRVDLQEIADEGNITVLGNSGHDISLFEINNESAIAQKMLELKDVFDIVLIESSALTTLNQSKEWIVVADRVLCVYEANTSIKNGMKDQILYLKSMEGKFIGWMLNKVTK